MQTLEMENPFPNNKMHQLITNGTPGQSPSVNSAKTVLATANSLHNITLNQQSQANIVEVDESTIEGGDELMAVTQPLFQKKILVNTATKDNVPSSLPPRSESNSGSTSVYFIDEYLNGFDTSDDKLNYERKNSDAISIVSNDHSERRSHSSSQLEMFKIHPSLYNTVQEKHGSNVNSVLSDIEGKATTTSILIRGPRDKSNKKIRFSQNVMYLEPIPTPQPLVHLVFVIPYLSIRGRFSEVYPPLLEKLNHPKLSRTKFKSTLTKLNHEIITFVRFMAVVPPMRLFQSASVAGILAIMFTVLFFVSRSRFSPDLSMPLPTFIQILLGSGIAASLLFMLCMTAGIYVKHVGNNVENEIHHVLTKLNDEPEDHKVAKNELESKVQVQWIMNGEITSAATLRDIEQDTKFAKYDIELGEWRGHPLVSRVELAPAGKGVARKKAGNSFDGSAAHFSTGSFIHRSNEAFIEIHVWMPSELSSERFSNVPILSKQ